MKFIIPPEIKAAIGIVGALAILCIGWAIHHHIDQSGYNRRVTEEAAETQKAKEEAQKKLTEVEKRYAPRIKEIYEAPDNDSIVGPLTTRAVDGL